MQTTSRLASYRNSKNELKLLDSATCVVEAMQGAARVDMIRNLETGLTTVQPSSLKGFQYLRDGPIEELKGIKLEHSYACPALDKQMTNPSKPLRLCCCILLQHGDQCLVTKRTSHLSFPGSWVLPGGGIEGAQTVFEAGLRECFEEVGRKYSTEEIGSITHNEVMMWQSHYVKDNQVHRGNLVVFMTIPTLPFAVKVQQSEVQRYQWQGIRSVSESVIYNEKDRLGFGEGHIRYCGLVSSSLKHLN